VTGKVIYHEYYYHDIITPLTNIFSLLAEDVRMQFHILSFEGPDAYASAGGIASRVSGLAQALAEAGFETHLWFVGDPELPGHEAIGNLHLHRWCQWISKFHSAGVYDGEEGKRADYVASLPPFLWQDVLLPHLQQGGSGVILAEEWQTVDAVLHLDWLLRQARMREKAVMFWNANNTFSFHRIDWGRLTAAATITTVSRYMKHLMQPLGVNPLVVPNGLSHDALVAPESEALAAFRSSLRQRAVITKVARWDPDKRWLLAVATVATLRQQGWRPLLIARGGIEAHGQEVMAAAAANDLRVVERVLPEPGVRGLLQAMDGLDRVDIVSVRSHLNSEARRLLMQGSTAVLANSGHEPFGLVGLETMAVGGLACTGCSGEDYAIPGYNALVLETDDPREFIGLYGQLRANPPRERAMRRAGYTTAMQYTWARIIQRILVPRLQLRTGVISPVTAGPTTHPATTRMRVRIEGRDLQIAPQLLGWIADRLEDLNSSHADISEARVTLSKHQGPRRHRDAACVELMVGSTALETTQMADSLYGAASIALKTIEQELRELRTPQLRTPVLAAS
jgi:glycosyltransferase involved in cell wall biosynthesis/ribosome-associated translation inhibitor RaiA